MAYSLGQQVYQILAVVMDQEVAKQHFNEPVDPAALGIPDYVDIIKEPMDLGTIRARLVQGYYRHPSEVYGDVHLVWHNCRTYNEPDSALVAQCNQLAALFEGMWRKLDFGAQQQAGGNGQGQARGANGGGGPSEQLSFRRQLQQHLAAEQAAGHGEALSPQGSQQLHHHATRHKPPHAAAVGAAVAAATGAGASALRAGHPLKRCLAVLEQLLQLSATQPFWQPDPALMGLQAGHMPHPTDLGTIRDRLAPGLENGWGTISYKSTAEVLADVRGVFNCRRLYSDDDETRALCNAAEREFMRVWHEAGLPVEQSSPPASGTGLVHGGGGGAPNSPTSLLSHGASLTASLTAVHPGGKGQKRPSNQRSMAELSSGDVAPSADISAAASAGAKRQRKERSGSGGARATATRCDVCVRCKKGKCGTDSAPRNCRRRMARAAAAAAQKEQAAAAAGLAAQESLALPRGAAAAAVASALARGGGSQRLPAEVQLEYLPPPASVERLVDMTAVEAEVPGAGARVRRPLRPGSDGKELGGVLTPTGAAAAAYAAVHNTSHPDNDEAALSSQPGRASGKGGCGAKGVALAPGTDGLAASEAQGGLQREREVLAAWARLQKKREAAAEAVAAAQDALRTAAEAREVLRTVDQLEQEGDEQLGVEVATPWPPGATFASEGADLSSATPAARRLCFEPLLRLGAHWLGNAGLAARERQPVAAGVKMEEAAHRWVAEVQRRLRHVVLQKGLQAVLQEAGGPTTAAGGG